MILGICATVITLNAIGKHQIKKDRRAELEKDILELLENKHTKLSMKQIEEYLDVELISDVYFVCEKLVRDKKLIKSKKSYSDTAFYSFNFENHLTSDPRCAIM